MVRAMYRLVLLAAAALAACDQTENDRPPTIEYITAAILQPSCGQATCHSSFRRAEGYAFDTLEEARKSLAGLVIAGDVEGSFLNTVLTRTVKRMPYDAPLQNKDIALIQRWIDEGAIGVTP